MMIRTRCWHKGEDELRDKLRGYRVLVSQYKALKELYDTLFPNGTVKLQENVSCSSQEDLCPLERIVQDRLDTRVRLENTLEELLKETQEILELIEALPESEKTVMQMRYLNLMPWIRIEREMHLCERQLRRIHDRAMRRILDETRTKSEEVRPCPICS